MTYYEILAAAKQELTALDSHLIDVIDIKRPPSLAYAKNLAKARNLHYHKPPDYLVFELEDTSERTVNLQQTNTNGYKLQQDKCSITEARAVVDTWGEGGKIYSPAPEYQRLLRTLYGQFVYRLDTNYAKIDRIEHTEIEAFKSRVLSTEFHGKTIRQWSTILASNNDRILEAALQSIL